MSTHSRSPAPRPPRPATQLLEPDGNPIPQVRGRMFDGLLEGLLVAGGANGFDGRTGLLLHEAAQG
eukprot:4666898-Pyramimonas_sp.AAC.1